MKLGTPEYMDEVVKRTNSDAKYLELSKGESEIYTLVLEAEPDKGVAENLTLKLLIKYWLSVTVCVY